MLSLIVQPKVRGIFLSTLSDSDYIQGHLDDKTAQIDFLASCSGILLLFIVTALHLLPKSLNPICIKCSITT